MSFAKMTPPPQVNSPTQQAESLQMQSEDAMDTSTVSSHPEALVQARIQKAADTSPRVMQLKALQSAINRGPRTNGSLPLFADNQASTILTQRYSRASDSVIQRDLLNEGADAKANIKSEDAMFELMAHSVAYNKGDWQKFLGDNGYTHNPEDVVIGTGLKCMLIKHNGDKRPILAFKGTSPDQLGDVLADLDPIAVGAMTFNSNKEKVGELVARSGGNLVVTGHSLGGALAQHCGVAFSSSISKVVTFQAPGIDVSSVRAFNKLEEEEQPEVVHHLAEGDIVGMAGNQHLGGSGLLSGDGNGQFFEHTLSDRNVAAKHTSYLLQDDRKDDLGQAHQDLGLTDKKFGATGVSEYDDDIHDNKQAILEGGRMGASAGGALALGGAALGKSGLKNWKEGGKMNKAKGAGKMALGGAVGLVGATGALAGGAVGLAGGALVAGGKATGKAAVKGGKAVGKAVVKGGKAVGSALAEGAQTVGDTVESGVDSIKRKLRRNNN